MQRDRRVIKSGRVRLPVKGIRVGTHIISNLSIPFLRVPRRHHGGFHTSWFQSEPCLVLGMGSLLLV